MAILLQYDRSKQAAQADRLIDLKRRLFGRILELAARGEPVPPALLHRFNNVARELYRLPEEVGCE